jgi:AcrR family transcriptional regulator
MPPEKRSPISRRERPAKPALTREGIVATAMEVLRAEGLERVTMRRLAQDLDTGAASLYVYVRNTAELHAFILDELLGEVLWSYTAILLEHPGLAQSALVTRPSGPGYLQVVDGVLAVLKAGDVPDDRAAWAVDLLLHFATSTATEQGTRQRAIDAQEEEDRAAATLLELSADTFPHIAALGADLLSGEGPDRSTWGFHVLINGVLQTPRPGATP